MAGADGFLTYPELIGEVRRLCAQRQTGCVFITTSDNHSVRFALQGGTIVAVAFRQRTGPDALTSIRRISKGRLQFSDTAPSQEPQPGISGPNARLGAFSSRANVCIAAFSRRQ